MPPSTTPFDQHMFSGKYVAREEIARGGMGVIYLAVDAKLGRNVAIKVLHPQYSSDPAFAERFLREARAMARLDHDNIIGIHAVEEEENCLCIVMEYCLGKDLKKLIRERGRLSVAETVNICLQVASALAYAHRQGIVHRDIKPANIMVDPDLKAKIADFGIAAALDDISITLPGQIIGTTQYMSPEQARGERLDGRSDLYSLGIVMYEMLVGQTPYHDISRTAILGQLLQDRRELVMQFPSDIPVALQGLVQGLTRRDPHERIQNASTLLQQLRDVNLQGQVDAEESAKTEILEEGRPPEPPPPVQPELSVPRKYNLSTLIVVSLGALIILGSTFYYVSHDTKRPPPTVPDPLPPRPIPPPPQPDPVPPIETNPPPSPTPPPKPPGITEEQKQLNKLKSKFKAAYERQDLEALSKVSELSEARRQQLDLMFQAYKTIKVNVQMGPIKDKGASGSVVITDLILPDGSHRKPSPIIERTKISIRKNGDQWGKIIWQDD